MALLTLISLLAGYYMFIETSNPRTSGDVAVLESTWLSNEAESCMIRFWYHMYGSNIGSLAVYSLDELGTKRDIWTKSGEQVCLCYCLTVCMSVCLSVCLSV